jgi:glycosyltransferase involved in cell wall biosynthesis
MAEKTLHQVLAGTGPGDAITDQALLIRAWLREAGYRSDIYAWHIHPDLEREVRPFGTFRPGNRQRRVLYHHSIGTPVVERLAQQRCQVLLVYHNITPPEFFDGIDPGRAELARQGVDQLDQLRPLTTLGLAVSPYNARDLADRGFAPTDILPITVDVAQLELPSDDEIVADLAATGPNLLFVGRLAPNKKQEDLVRLLFHYRQIRPNARLTLIGDRWLLNYDHWIMDMARHLGVADGVRLTGQISWQAMATYYRHSDLYVSMSEHEGFGKPLIESMYLGLPVLAYAGSAVPETLGKAGLLFHDKAYPALAELADLVIHDPTVRQPLIAAQRARVRHFLPATGQAILAEWLARMEAA